MAQQDILDKFWESLTQYIDDAARNRIERLCGEHREIIPVAIARLGLAPDDQVVAAYRKILKLDAVTQKDIPEDISADDGLNTQFLKTRKLLPLSSLGKDLELGMVDPLDDEALAGITFATGKIVTKKVMPLPQWRTAFDKLYGQTTNGSDEDNADMFPRAGWADDAARLRDMSSEAPVIRQVEQLLTEAADKGASDIHVEPAPNATRIRYRIDGRMLQARETSPEAASIITSRIKVMCDMDVADRRRPQDGRTSVAVRGRPVDLRVSTVPTAYGESLAIRLLDRSASLLDLDTLGFSEHDLAMIKSMLERPKGIFLVTGPTGSGKTTTLYAALNRLRQVDRKILTVEDPIEYFFEDINQVQVNEAAGVSFASALRSFLRQDPDIMMVGEIRDAETARIAVQAALTGHLVLATLHTNDAISSIARLKDMGIENYLIAATVSGITAQRLVKKVCKTCKASTRTTSTGQKSAQDCKACEGSGYKGRTVISEGFSLTPTIGELIRQSAQEELILEAARQGGLQTMLEDGRSKAANGSVVLEDVYAAVGRI